MFQAPLALGNKTHLPCINRNTYPVVMLLYLHAYVLRYHLTVCYTRMSYSDADVQKNKRQTTALFLNVIARADGTNICWASVS